MITPKISYYPNEETYKLSKEELKEQWGCNCCRLTEKDIEQNSLISNAINTGKICDDINKFLECFDVEYIECFKGSRMELIKTFNYLSRVDNGTTSEEYVKIAYYSIILSNIPKDYDYIIIDKDYGY